MEGGSERWWGGSCHIWGICLSCMGQIESIVRSLVEAEDIKDVRDVVEMSGGRDHDGFVIERLSIS